MNPTETINRLIQQGAMSKTDVAEKLGITRVTLNTRLQKGNWKKGEIAIIRAL